jgi:hypothetical protein
MLIDERTSYGNTFNCAKDPLVHEILRRTIEAKEIIRQTNEEMDWTSNLVGKYNLFNPEGFIDLEAIERSRIYRLNKALTDPTPKSPKIEPVGPKFDIPRSLNNAKNVKRDF